MTSKVDLLLQLARAETERDQWQALAAELVAAMTDNASRNPVTYHELLSRPDVKQLA